MESDSDFTDERAGPAKRQRSTASTSSGVQGKYGKTSTCHNIIFLQYNISVSCREKLKSLFY